MKVLLNEGVRGEPRGGIRGELGGNVANESAGDAAGDAGDAKLGRRRLLELGGEMTPYGYGIELKLCAVGV